MLGEESTAGGMARYVDSSVERIQVRLIGADRQRYVVTANGHPIPLLATDNPDIQVGGLRFRAGNHPVPCTRPSPSTDHCASSWWTPRPARHVAAAPTTCRTRAAGPYDHPPVNAVEAESRRGRRFETTGFTPGKVDLSDIRRNRLASRPTWARRKSRTCAECVPFSSNGPTRTESTRHRQPAVPVPHRAGTAGAVLTSVAAPAVGTTNSSTPQAISGRTGMSSPSVSANADAPG